MSDPAFNGFGEQDDGFGVTLSWSFAIFFVSSIIGTYLTVKLFDRFLRTEISEEHLARLIARLEQGEDQRTRRQTMFVNMTEEERRNVLEKVLLRKVSALYFINANVNVFLSSSLVTRYLYS